MTKVLFAITSYYGPFYDDGAKTGLFAIEAIHPFEVFKAKNFDIDFVSETGTFGYDEHSTSEAFLLGDERAIFLDKNSEYNVAIEKIKKASDVKAEDYDIFFAAGGHGCCFDFPKATQLGKLASDIYAKGGIVSAVCHGPTIFEVVNDEATGKPLIAGKNVTAFLNSGEQAMGLDNAFSSHNLDTPETIFKKLGANFKSPDTPFEDFVVTDGRVISGCNPASAASTAKAAIAALN